MLRRSYTSAAAAHIHGRPRGVTRDPRRCNGHPRPLPGAARRAAPLSANACSTALVARARLPQAACCAVQGVGHDVSPCSGPLGAALGSGGAWRGARLLPGLQYGRYLSRFADILRDSRFRTPISFAIRGRVHLVSCAAHGPPLAAHQCVTPLAIFSWLAKQDRIERELSATRLSLSQLQNKSSQPPVPRYSSTVCNTDIQLSFVIRREIFRDLGSEFFFPQKGFTCRSLLFTTSQQMRAPFYLLN